MRNASCKSALAMNAPFPKITIRSTQWSSVWKATVENSGRMYELTDLVLEKFRS